MSRDVKKIVIIDDDVGTCHLLARILSPFYDCHWTTDGAAASTFILSHRPDVILLDYYLPAVSGIEICRWIRENRETRSTPVIFVSGGTTIDEKIYALENGASDFILKPFNFQELALRVAARLGKTKCESPPQLFAGNLRMDVLSRRVFIDGREHSLTQKQFDILKFLMIHQNDLVTRQECMEFVWGSADTASRKLDSHISYLKGRIKNFNGRIINVAGQGYCLETQDKAGRKF